MKRMSITTILPAAIMAGAAGGDELHWACSNQAFDSDSAWVGFGVPGAEDTAIFDCPWDNVVDFTQDHACARLIVREGEFDFDLAGFALDLLQTGFTEPALVVGDFGYVPPLLLVNGGTVTAAYVDLGADPVNSGAVTVTGPQGLLHAGLALRVGRYGEGALAIVDGARVEADSAFLAYGITANGAVSVGGAGSTLYAEGPLRVGHAGNGDMTLSDGALVDCGSASIGLHPASTGDVTVTGATWTIAGGLDVGFRGQGTLVVEDGAEVSAGGFCTMAASFDFDIVSSGAVTVSGPGSVLSVGAGLYVAIAGPADLSVERGGVVTVGGDLVFGGWPPTVVRVGIAADGHYAMGPAIDVDGVTDVPDDDTTLVVELLDGYAPAGHATFHLLRSQTSAALLPYVSLPAAPLGYKWTPSVVADGLLANYHEAADVTMDGVVNTLDLTQVIIDWGICPEGLPCPSDVNGDGVVSVTDLVLVLQGWG